MNPKETTPDGFFQIAVSAVIENRDGKILIMKRSQGNDHHSNEWEIVSGRIKQNETDMTEALRREIHEEAGVDVTVVAPFRTFYFERGETKAPHFGVNFYCRYLGEDDAVSVDGLEQSNFEWVTPQEAITRINNEDIRNAVKRYLEVKTVYEAQ